MGMSWKLKRCPTGVHPASRNAHLSMSPATPPMVVVRGKLEALNVGIDFEYKTVKFYQDYLPRAKDALERQFVEEMVAEERGRYTVLKDMKHSMADPAAWYQEMERGGLDSA